MTAATGRRTTLTALAADAVCIVVFTALGRRNHHGGVSLSGLAETAWPFLLGAAVGWLVARGWRRPTSTATGITVWVCAIAVGMLLRHLTSAGTAASFVVVAGVVTGVLLLGWRAAWATATRREGSGRSRSGS